MTEDNHNSRPFVMYTRISDGSYIVNFIHTQDSGYNTKISTDGVDDGVEWDRLNIWPCKLLKISIVHTALAYPLHK